MENKKLIIAIDGPASAGKSTIAKILAKKLGYTYIDTGAMYRCLGLWSLRNNVAVDDVEGLVKGANQIEILLDPKGTVYLDGEDVSKEIRETPVSRVCSPVSRPVPVREVMVRKQQELAAKSSSGVVMDGRDIGTVVLTNANIKIFQTASVEVRAQRRYKENLEKGVNLSYEEVKQDLIDRDYSDTHKEWGALKKAEDAIELDTSNMTIDEVVSFIYNKALELM